MKTGPSFSKIVPLTSFKFVSLKLSEVFYLSRMNFVKKIAYQILILWGVVTLVFVLFNVTGSDPVSQLVGESATEEVKQNVRIKLGYHKTAWIRYCEYLNNLSPVGYYQEQDAQGAFNMDTTLIRGVQIFSISNSGIYLKWPSFGRSFITDQSVFELYLESFPGTLLLAIASIVLSIIIGIPLGIWAYKWHGTWLDNLILFISAIGVSGPSFFVAILVAWIGAVLLQPYTGLNMTGSWYEVDVWEGRYVNFSNMILPMITLMIRPLSVIVQLVRSSMLEVMSMDYIRTARAKGVSEFKVLYKHALPNALNPVVTAISGWFASLLAGAVFVEFVFGWKGIGQLMYSALEKQDLPIIMAGVIWVAIIFILVHVLVEFIYRKLDPRISD